MRLPDQLLPRQTAHDLSVMQQIVAFDAAAFADGMQITLEHDFHALKALSDRLDKLPLTPNFDPLVSDIGPTNGFWLKGIASDGRVVMQQAARLYDWRHSNLALMHESLHAFYREPETTAEAGETCRCEAPAAHLITGNVCYHGELWIDPRWRRHGTTRYLARLLMAVVQLRWQPDYFFGLAQPGICTKGVAARYGYRNGQPHGMIWHIPSQGTLDEWLIWNTQQDLRNVLSNYDAINGISISSDNWVTDNTVGVP